MGEVINILMKEHENILKFVKILEGKSNSMAKEIDKEFFTKAIDFIRNYADKFHHAKEEDILFKEICKKENELHCNPIEQMLHEHNIGRDFVKGMKEALEKRDKKNLVENALGYVQLIREHIFKEDNILYPMANEVLNEKVKKNMFEKFEKISKENKNKERLLSLIKEFKKR